MEKLKVEICVGTACHIMGAHALVEFIESLPGWIREKIDYRLSSCFGVCNEGKKPPIVRVNGEYYEDVSPEILNGIIMEVLERGDTS